jgi:hypothetical protein
LYTTLYWQFVTRIAWTPLRHNTDQANEPLPGSQYRRGLQQEKEGCVRSSVVPAGYNESCGSNDSGHGKSLDIDRARSGVVEDGVVEDGVIEDGVVEDGAVCVLCILTQVGWCSGRPPFSQLLSHACDNSHESAAVSGLPGPVKEHTCGPLPIVSFAVAATACQTQSVHDRLDGCLAACKRLALARPLRAPQGTKPFVFPACSVQKLGILRDFFFVFFSRQSYNARENDSLLSWLCFICAFCKARCA